MWNLSFVDDTRVIELKIPKIYKINCVIATATSYWGLYDLCSIHHGKLNFLTIVTNLLTFLDLVDS